jgi:UDP-N-acetylglucosamine 1-carboxyvinyltransferase
MSQLVIEGGKTLAGTIPVFGSKNAALPLLTASLLTRDEVTLDNIPAIADVHNMISIFRSIGVQVAQRGSQVSLRAAEINPDTVDQAKVGMLRGSILLLGALLARLRRAAIPRPGGDIIGQRPLGVHLDGLRQLGAKAAETDEAIIVDGTAMRAGQVVLQEFSVTATENLMLAAATLPGRTTIHIAAAEPHVVALARLLQAMGVAIQGAGTHTITIDGGQEPQGASFTNIPDMLEAGLFILLAAATKSTVRVKGVPTDHLVLFLKKLEGIGIRFEVQDDTVAVQPSTMSAFQVKALPYPGLATDLQAPFAVIATQARGTSLIHDPLYEGRFKHIAELQKMGADAIVCDPHRVTITGPTQLVGRRIPSLDIRAGATLIMAGLVAEGETIIDQAEIVERGYAQLTERLQALGARISRKEEK